MSPQGISGGVWGGNAPPGKLYEASQGSVQRCPGGGGKGRCGIFWSKQGDNRGLESISHAFMTLEGRRIRVICWDNE